MSQQPQSMLTFLSPMCRHCFTIIILLIVAVPRSRGDTLPPPRDHDFETLYSIQQRRTPTHNRYWTAVSNSLALSPVPAIGHGLYGWATGDRQVLYNAAELGGSWLLTAGVTMSLKYLINRPRPYVAHASDLVCLQPLPDPSFPSGHTSFCFATATSLSLIYPRWYVVIPSYLWATGVAYSRLYIGAHYPTDVVAGALIGTSCAVVAYWVRNCIMRQHPDLALANPSHVSFSFAFHL